MKSRSSCSCTRRACLNIRTMRCTGPRPLKSPSSSIANVSGVASRTTAFLIVPAHRSDATSSDFGNSGRFLRASTILDRSALALAFLPITYTVFSAFWSW